MQVFTEKKENSYFRELGFHGEGLRTILDTIFYLDDIYATLIESF